MLCIMRSLSELRCLQRGCLVSWRHCAWVSRRSGERRETAEDEEGTSWRHPERTAADLWVTLRPFLTDHLFNVFTAELQVTLYDLRSDSHSSWGSTAALERHQINAIVIIIKALLTKCSGSVKKSGEKWKKTAKIIRKVSNRSAVMHH